MNLRWQSLRNRLVFGVLIATVLSLWAVTLAISNHLRQAMEAAISSQQYSTVSLIASEIDRSVNERLKVLNGAARLLAGAAEKGDSPQRWLEQQDALLSLFNWGAVLVDQSGIAVASIPASLQRQGTDYSDLPAVAGVIASGLPFVTEPMIGRRTGAPVLSMIVPVSNAAGVVQGALLGVTNLQQPNFLDEISNGKYGRTGDFLLTAPKSRVFIASSDKRRLMVKGPPPGVNPVFDRYLDGFEGSGVAVSSRGVEELSSSRRVPATGWLMQSVLPTEEAFEPIRIIQHHLIVVSLLLTVLAGVLAWWWVRLQLRPMENAAALLDRMRSGALPRQALPVGRLDEFGQLATAFNGLLQTIDEQEAQLVENIANRRLRKILSHVPGMVFQYRLHADGSGSFPFASDAVRDIYEVSPEELASHAGKIRAMVHPDDREGFFKSMQRSAATFEPWKTDYRIVFPDGRTKWLHVDAVPEEAEDGLTVWYGFVTDVTTTKGMESELRIAAATFESQEGIFVTDAEGVILRVNRAFTAITGYAEQDAIGQKPAFLKSGLHDQLFFQRLWRALLEEGYWRGEISNRCKNGAIFVGWVTISAVRDTSGKITHYVTAFTDITEHKKSEERIYNLAFFDPLTELPNRRLLLDRVRQAEADSERSRQYGALVFLDLDRFKVLNDTRGHDVGDQLLKEVASRLGERVRAGDTVARLGGDEFIVLLKDIGRDVREAAGQAEMIAEKLRQALCTPYALLGQPYLSSSSIGVTLFVGKESGVDVLLKQADLALYQAKAAGRNAIRFFDPAMQYDLDERAALESGLRDALKNGGLELYYQPQVDAAGRYFGAEALLRWFSAPGVMVSPGEFIPVAEETGLILPIGDWVLEAACHRLACWAADSSLATLVLSINISPRQFAQGDFVSRVRAAMQRHGVEPGRLKLELTESVVLGNVDEVIARMLELKRLGVAFSLDDFGTGYSSLSYLKRLPLDQVKIDQSFVRDLVNDPDDAAIVRAIIRLGETLDLHIVAEGVETHEQRNFLESCACTAYQGYLFGRPMSAAAFEEFIRR